MTKRRRTVAATLVGMALAIGAPGAASAAEGGARELEVEYGTGPVTIEELKAIGNYTSVSTGGARLVAGPPSGQATIQATRTWQRTHTTTWRDLGVTVATHAANTTWSGDGNGRMYSSPKAVSTDVGTMPGISTRNRSAKWDWYNAGQGKTAQSNSYVDIILGIPTKWGVIGATQSSRIRVQVNGYGGAGRL